MTSTASTISVRQAGELREVKHKLISRCAIAMFALLLLGLAGSTHLTSGKAQAAVGMRPDEVRALAAMSTGDQSGVMRKGDSAKKGNALIPLSREALDRPGRLADLQPNTPAFETALQCLSQAIYYEAANEPLTGKRAVAQVVINRLRHPAYPNSVCGVVYEGSNKAVCQFSFTCDGSLLRAPGGIRWTESRRVAEAMLSGETEASVGTATHYHADYVLPRWAFTLGKITKIGAHIFYRFPGPWGRSAAFADRWSGTERIPDLDYARLRAALAGRVGGGATTTVPGLTVEPHITDRHAVNDVGGRIDVNRGWRLELPDPGKASAGYKAMIEGQGEAGTAVGQDHS